MAILLFLSMASARSAGFRGAATGAATTTVGSQPHLDDVWLANATLGGAGVHAGMTLDTHPQGHTWQDGHSSNALMQWSGGEAHIACPPSWCAHYGGRALLSARATPGTINTCKQLNLLVNITFAATRQLGAGEWWGYGHDSGVFSMQISSWIAQSAPILKVAAPIWRRARLGACAALLAPIWRARARQAGWK